jgi:cytoskeletal protein RodZ
MTDINRAAARARGQALRGARLARARRIRQRIIAGALTVFVAAWLLITLVLVSGHDPALAKHSSATAVASSRSSTSASSASSTSSTTTTTSATPSADTSSGVSSVTTSQS